jgi:hypothetical protein
LSLTADVIAAKEVIYSWVIAEQAGEQAEHLGVRDSEFCKFHDRFPATHS